MASISGPVGEESSKEEGYRESSYIQSGSESNLPAASSSTPPTASSDNSSLANNVMAAISMAEVIRSTLGPRGLDKLLVDQLGNRVVTNDGYTVLVSMKVAHPIGRLLVEIAERQQFSVGDGTTTAVVMAAEMLKEGYRTIVEYRVHPTKVINQIDHAVKLVVTQLASSATPVPSLNSPLIRNVVRTATASKLDGLHVSGVIMEALELLNQRGRADLRHGIILLRRLGEDLLIEGVAIEHLPRESSFVESLQRPKVILIKDTLKPPLLGHKLDGENETFDKERSSLISNLVSNQINLVITNAPDVETATIMGLTSKRIAFVRTSTEELDLLSRALNIAPTFGIDVLNNQFHNKIFGLENVVLDEDNRITILRQPKSDVVVATLIIGGATNETSKERMRTVTDGISAAHFALKGGVVAGGGIAELNAARFLQEHEMEQQGSQIPGIEVVVKGLESISRQILENSGYNSYETLLRLKSRPDSIGIDIDTGEYIDMIKEGIVDPVIVKTSAIQIAAHITKTILKIDRNLLTGDGGRTAI